jgi:AraC-like DNA-binding protein
MALWRTPGEIKRAMKEGLAIVHRKHKRRQQKVGPQICPMDELFVVVNGEIEVRLEGRWHPAPPRSLTCIRRGQYYGIRQRPGYDDSAQIVNILFRAPKAWNHGLPRPPLRLPAPWWRRVMDLEAKCDFDASGQRVLPLAEVTGFIERLAHAAVNPETKRESAALRDGPRRPDTGAEWMEVWAQAEDTIRERAGAGLTVEELAAAVHVSPTQLRRVYQSARGIAPKTALTQFRIDEAKRLLGSGKWNATQVSEKTGFTTLQRFSAVFKSVTGQSPSEYARSL